MKLKLACSFLAFFATFAQLLIAPAQAAIDPICRELLVTEVDSAPQFPLNLGLLSQKWKMKYPSLSAFELVAYTYQSSQHPIDNSDLIKGLGNSLAVLTQSSSVSGSNYVQRLKDEGLITFSESSEDGRRKIPLITQRASQRFIDFIVENNVNSDEVNALLNFQMTKWRSYHSRTHLTLVLFTFQQIISRPEGVGPDVIVNALLSQTDLSEATGKLMLRHLVADELVASVKSPVNAARRNYTLTPKGEKLLLELQAEFNSVSNY